MLSRNWLRGLQRVTGSTWKWIWTDRAPGVDGNSWDAEAINDLGDNLSYLAEQSVYVDPAAIVAAGQVPADPEQILSKSIKGIVPDFVSFPRDPVDATDTAFPRGTTWLNTLRESTFVFTGTEWLAVRQPVPITVIRLLEPNNDIPETAAFAVGTRYIVNCSEWVKLADPNEPAGRWQLTKGTEVIWNDTIALGATATLPNGKLFTDYCELYFKITGQFNDFGGGATTQAGSDHNQMPQQAFDSIVIRGGEVGSARVDRVGNNQFTLSAQFGTANVTQVIGII